MKYRFSRKANIDIDSIWLYTFENWSHAQADKYYNEIIAEIRKLAARPEIGRKFTHGDRSYRYSQLKSHLIFYREISATEIEVIRILHKRMDIENRLSE